MILTAVPGLAASRKLQKPRLWQEEELVISPSYSNIIIKCPSLAEEDEDENPWAGSLRHVKDKPRKNQKHDEKEDAHGGAPWMGTLRHVVHDNKVSKKNCI